MKIFFTEYFKGQLKKLKKKHPHVKDDFLQQAETLDLNNEIHIGKSIYKVRIKSSDLSKGKSSGFRSYMYLYRKNKFLVPLCIYHKSHKESLTKNELNHHFNKTIHEFFLKFE